MIMKTRNAINTAAQTGNARIYGRFSSVPQERGDSRRRQIEGANTFAGRNGLTVVGDPYFDEGVSGKAGLEVVKARGVKLGNPNPNPSLKRARAAYQTQKRAFATDAMKSIREIQSTGIESLNRIADCMNKRGERTARGGVWTATAVKRVLAVT